MRPHGHPDGHGIQKDRGMRDRRQVQRDEQEDELGRKGRTGQKARPKVCAAQPLRATCGGKPQGQDQTGQRRPKPREEDRLQPVVHDLDDDLV